MPTQHIFSETLLIAGLLGVRHGLDPDHLAVIDGLTYRALDDRPKWAPWTGALFSIGHSASVMLIAIALGCLGAWFVWPPLVTQIMAWVAIGLLFVIGVMNLKALISPSQYQPRGWKHGLLPGLARTSSHPLSVLATGLVFGLVVDTATQIAALSTTLTGSRQVFYPAMVGFVFALGMILTDGLDSLLIARVSRHGLRHAMLYRRVTGWLIVALSFGVALAALKAQITEA